VRNDQIALILQQRQDQDVRALNQAQDEFRKLHQQAPTRREYDLYDPDAKKKDRPARVSDDDPRCGIASLQKFQGEDINSKVCLNCILDINSKVCLNCILDINSKVCLNCILDTNSKVCLNCTLEVIGLHCTQNCIRFISFEVFHFK